MRFLPLLFALFNYVISSNTLAQSIDIIKVCGKFPIDITEIKNRANS